MANLSSKTGFSPVQTRVTLANNALTTVQNFAAYDAQELTGHVYVDATTDYRAAVKVTIFKNGAGTYEIAISDVAGDLLSGSPIVTFSISAAGVLSATLPNFTGYSTAYIQYNLNAPQLGAMFPLTVDGSNVTLATSTVQGAYKAGQAPGGIPSTSTATAYPTAGNFGEYKEYTGSSLALPASGVVATVGSADAATLSLTPGIWDLGGFIEIGSGSTITTSYCTAWFGTGTGTSTAGRTVGLNYVSKSMVINGSANDTIILPTYRVNVTATTPYYLKIQTGYSGGTITANALFRAIRIA